MALRQKLYQMLNGFPVLHCSGSLPNHLFWGLVNFADPIEIARPTSSAPFQRLFMPLFLFKRSIASDFGLCFNCLGSALSVPDTND